MSEIDDAVQKKIYEKKMEVVVNALLKLQYDLQEEFRISGRHLEEYDRLSKRYYYIAAMSVEDAYKEIQDNYTLRCGEAKMAYQKLERRNTADG